MISLPRIAVTALGAMALSSCGNSGEGAAEGEATNSRILEGSASDEMISYEKLRSEPPAAKIEESETGGKSSGQSGSAPGAAPQSGPVVPDPIQPAPSPTTESGAPDSPED